MNEIETHLCFGGTLGIYEHKSSVLNSTMRFSVFIPPQAKRQNVPFISFLSGLTCSHENFTTKAGAYGFAAKQGLAIIVPDTSPRGDDVPDDESYDLGQGASFYINATQAPWAKNYQMEDYIVGELNALVCESFPLLKDKQGITGHSMGGHGALTLGLKYPELFKSISAFAPIVAPSQVPWGEKAFMNYLSQDKQQWLKHDAVAIMATAGDRSHFPEILIDLGSDDSFIEKQLKPHLFERACDQAKQVLQLRIQSGYDHSYYFIQSFIENHVSHHANILVS